MRLFVAIQLSEEMLRAVRSVQEEFRRRGVKGNYTPAENLHLTMAFIGEYPDPEAVLRAMESVRLTPFELSLEGVGAFGDLWWLGLRHSEALEGCVRRLRHALAEAEIPFDRKRFRPHITLIRRASMPAGALPGVEAPGASMRVEEVALMRSDRGRNGMIYTRIG